MNDTNVDTHTHTMNINTHYDINSLYTVSVGAAQHLPRGKLKAVH